MLFPTIEFIFAFAPISIIGFWLIRSDRLRRAWLVLASYFFYGYWDPRFLPLLIITSLINYYSALFINRSDNPAIRKKWLFIALTGNLALLGFFKYFMLLMKTVNAISGWIGAGAVFPAWNIILPIGISFFTFQAMSYTIDVYRGKTDPTDDIVEFSAYVALFPQLIAGPIVRYIWIRDRIRNLKARLTINYLNLGIFFFTLGLMKKVLIADRIAYYSDPLFANYKSLAPIEAWLAILGFSLQLYFDFAGYSLMAIGLGYLLGFEFPMNFNSPYKAVSISDFWRRWHITLSTWLRDYLYIPLGGRDNRMVALAATMLLGGLWHGAEWTFVAWGAYHAILLELHHHLKGFRWIPRNPVLAQIGTFLLVTIGWVFFKPPTFEASWTILKKMFDIPGLFTPATIQLPLVALILVGGVWAMLAPNACELVREKNIQPTRSWAVALGLLGAVCILLCSESGPFLYFQF
ncbi:MAG TPA: MBOAT family protein [Firmicutes bacterium]|nr:MBOAT family protein [Bacillota bacterium]